MMWNWLVSGLAAGATLLLYDGSPFHPDGNVLWDYAARRAADAFRHVRQIHRCAEESRPRAREPPTISQPCALLMSTGSPLAPESFDYVYRSIKRDLHLASISGGTDICGCFVLGNPLRPSGGAKFRARLWAWPSMSVDDDGEAYADGKGELVCRNAFPSMPVGFWNDPDCASHISRPTSRAFLVSGTTATSPNGRSTAA